MKRSMTLLFLTLALTVTACRQRKVEIVMERHPQGGVWREVAVWNEDDGKVSETEPEFLQSLAKTYGQSTADEDGTHRFARAFKDEFPADIAVGDLQNRFRVGMLESSLGKSFAYVERVPGPHDPMAMFKAAQRALDVVVRALVAYVETQPDFKRQAAKHVEALKEFLNHEFRFDAENVLLMIVQAMGAQRQLDPPPPTAEGALIAEMQRILLFLHQRGYLSDEEWNAASQSPDGDTFAALRHGVLRKIAGVLGHRADQPLPAYLRSLEEDDALKQAFQSGLERIGMTEEEFEGIIDEAWHFSLVDDPTVLTIIWKSQTKPLQTNGFWDSGQGRLVWKSSAVKPPNWPDVLFAVWAEPAEGFQKSHFGEVVVIDKLPAFNVWYGHLDRNEAKEWDRFVEELHPAEDLNERLETFRFKNSPPVKASGDPNAKAEPLPGPALILAGLRAAEEAGRPAAEP